MNARTNVPSEGSFDPGRLTLDTFIDDIEQLRRQLDFDRIGVLGHSIYGLLALEYARKYPTHTARVIMHGTPPYPKNRIRIEYWESQASDERKRLYERNLQKLEREASRDLSLSESHIMMYVAMGPKIWCDPEFDASSLLEGVYWNVPVHDHLVDVLLSDYDAVRGDPTTIPIFLALGRHDYLVPHYIWDETRDRFPHLSYLPPVREERPFPDV